ncbi:MFS transporter [Alkalihalobacillus pseudalcaliphilus]|uniref:MFS transporter n=1 Tax=Alkalihalobacillus pseudalcaliphilus TaxID=79884 RepID=UPI00064DD027|nr:MFS transporter [Alkalihalobacillus pseudalcaliphilus]KMK78183.1 MFS transporter [Alkalihalobacillus pseudalcaliphilus]
MSQSFRYQKIFVIGSGFFALTLIWTFYNAFMPIILSAHIEKQSIIGFIMGLDNLFAILLIPIIGAWSDKVQSRFGKRLPFLMVGMPLAALFFILLPFFKDTLWILITIDILFLLAMTLYRAPVISLMPDHTPPPRRSYANGIINLMGGVGAIIALFGLSRLFEIDPMYPFTIASILLIICFFLLLFVVDRNPPYSSDTSGEQEETMAVSSLKEKFVLLFQKENRSALFILTAIFIYFIGYASVEALFTLYATQTLGFTSDVAGTTLGFFSLSFVLFALPAGWIGQKFGKIKTMMVGLISLPLIFVLIPAFSEPLSLQLILFIGGCAWALINVQAYPLVADLGGLTSIGLFTGFYYLFSMSANIVGPFFLGSMVDLFGGSTLFYVSACMFVVAFYVLYLGKKHLVQSERKVA